MPRSSGLHSNPCTLRRGLSPGTRWLVPLGIGALLATNAVWGAPPQLNYLFPAGAPRGQTASVTAAGSWSSWPVTVWVDRPGVQFTAESEKGKFQVVVDPKAEPGIYWLRLIHPEGASPLRPFLVGMLPEATEAEPNDDPAKPQAIPRPIVVNGKLQKREDVDTFAVTLEKGETLVAALQANQGLGTDMDAVLQICADRFVLDQNDDARGIDPLLTFTAPAAGTYLVRVFGFPATPNSTIGFAGDDSYRYRLTVTTSGFMDHVLPLAVSRGTAMDVQLQGWNLPPDSRISVPATDQDRVTIYAPEQAGGMDIPVVPHPSVLATPGSSPESPQSLPVPSTVSGVLAQPRDRHVFRITAQKGKAIQVDVESDELGFLLDASLAVADANGKILSEVDDAKKARDPQLNFTPPADGDYLLTIRDVHGGGGPRYAYRMTVSAERPDFQLRLAADTFALPAGGKLEIPVTVERGKGFTQEIEIGAADLPAGVTATPVTSQATGESAKSVKLILEGTPGAVSGPFRVVGRAKGDSPVERIARLGGDGVPPEVTQAWLTVPPAKP